MAKDLAKPGPQILADLKQLDAETIRKYICATANDKEIFFFLNQAAAYGLNPFKREIHLIKYKDPTIPANVVVGYEVYLKRAEETHQVEWWHAEVSEDGQIATCTIKRKDWTQPFVWPVDRKEFDKGWANWKTMPRFMLKKVAIAQAFRLVFPKELGGIPYTSEEIAPEVATTDYKVLPEQSAVKPADKQEEKPKESPSSKSADESAVSGGKTETAPVQSDDAESATSTPPPADEKTEPGPQQQTETQIEPPTNLTPEERQTMEKELKIYYSNLIVLLQKTIRPTTKLTEFINEVGLLAKIEDKVRKAEEKCAEYNIPLPED